MRTISLDFLDGKLVTLWIGYESTFKGQKLDEFVAGMSKVLNLPATWPLKRGGQQLTCDGFSVFASLIAGSPSIRINDDAAQETIANRHSGDALFGLLRGIEGGVGSSRRNLGRRRAPLD